MQRLQREWALRAVGSVAISIVLLTAFARQLTAQSQAEQAILKALAEEKPYLVMVAGDVNSTLATTLVAAKTNIPLAHIESGLRSFDSGRC